MFSLYKALCLIFSGVSIGVASGAPDIRDPIIAMREAGVAEKNIAVDKRSGKDFDCPGYQKKRAFGLEEGQRIGRRAMTKELFRNRL